MMHGPERSTPPPLANLADAEYDHDAGLELMDRTQRKRGDAAQQAQRDKARQVREFGRAARGQERCGRCFTSAARQRHLALAVGQGAYLALPPRGRLVPGHCQILPMGGCGWGWTC